MCAAEGRGERWPRSRGHGDTVPLSDVAGRALTLTADVVAQASVTTRALLGAVNAERSERARLCADRTLRGDTTGPSALQGSEGAICYEINRFRREHAGEDGWIPKVPPRIWWALLACVIIFGCSLSRLAAHWSLPGLWLCVAGGVKTGEFNLSGLNEVCLTMSWSSSQSGQREKLEFRRWPVGFFCFGRKELSARIHPSWNYGGSRGITS